MQGCTRRSSPQVKQSVISQPHPSTSAPRCGCLQQVGFSIRSRPNISAKLHLMLQSQPSNNICTNTYPPRNNLHHSCKSCTLHYLEPGRSHSYRGLHSFVFNVTLTLPITKNRIGSVQPLFRRWGLSGEQRRAACNPRGSQTVLCCAPPAVVCSAPTGCDARLIQSLRASTSLPDFFFRDGGEVMLTPPLQTARIDSRVRSL